MDNWIKTMDNGMKHGQWIETMDNWIKTMDNRMKQWTMDRNNGQLD